MTVNGFLCMWTVAILMSMILYVAFIGMLIKGEWVLSIMVAFSIIALVESVKMSLEELDDNE